MAELRGFVPTCVWNFELSASTANGRSPPMLFKNASATLEWFFALRDFSVSFRQFEQPPDRTPQILGGGGECELVFHAQRSSEPQTVEAQDTLQMREQHLNLLAPFLRDFVKRRRRATASKITHHLVFPALKAAGIAVRAALRLQWASLTARLCRAVLAWLHLGRDAVRVGIIPPRVPQILPLRTNKSVILIIPGKVGT